PFSRHGLTLFRAVAGTGALAVGDARGVKGAPDDLVADAGEVAHAATAHEHDGVLLEVVAFARDVGRDLDAARQAHAGDLAQGRVGLLRRLGGDAHAHAPALGRPLQGRGGRLL